jgi:hypothetical protein
MAGLDSSLATRYPRPVSVNLIDCVDVAHYGIRACYQTSSHSRRTAWLALSSAGVPSNTIRPWPIT